LLRPPIETGPPRALIHFLGGAIVGKAPHISYRYLLESLAKKGYMVVATPYDLSFDYLTTCDTILSRFEMVAATLARQYGALPVVGLGHSCGSVLQLLITSLFPDTPRGANALISFNNKPVTEAIPVFEEVVAPFFTYVAARNATRSSGSEILSVGLQLAKSATVGEVPYEFLETLEQIPLLIDEVADGARDFVPPPAEVKAAARRAYRARRTLIVKYTEDPLDESDEIEDLLQ
ncbi:predicted protein, partial [Phaeodactylum tricornutum CCAP 1055/1]